MEIFGNNTNNNLSLFGNFFTDKNKNAQSQESFLTSKNNNNFSFNVKNYSNKILLNPKDNNDKNKFYLYTQTNNDNKTLLNEQKSSIPLFDLKDTKITENKILYDNKNNMDSKISSRKDNNQLFNEHIFFNNDAHNKDNIDNKDNIKQNNNTHNEVLHDNNNNKQNVNNFNYDKSDDNKLLNLNKILLNENELKFSECKALDEYEKTQILYKTNNEILEELKSMLFKQKEKFLQNTENTRQIENKLSNILKQSAEHAKMSEINELRKNNLIQKIKDINAQSEKLKNVIDIKNKIITSALLDYKNNYMNNILFLGINNDRFSFFDELIDISKKCDVIDRSINYKEQILSKKEKNLSEKLNDDKNGFWIEKANNKKIFVNQNEMNSLLSECYDGLINLKNMQETFDSKYELIKKTLFHNNHNY